MVETRSLLVGVLIAVGATLLSKVAFGEVPEEAPVKTVAENLNNLTKTGEAELKDFTGQDTQVEVYETGDGDTFVPGYDIDETEGTATPVDPVAVEEELGLDAVSGTASDTTTETDTSDSFDYASAYDDLRDTDYQSTETTADTSDDTVITPDSVISGGTTYNI